MASAHQSPESGTGDWGPPPWMHPCLPRVDCMINAHEGRCSGLGHSDAGKQNQTQRWNADVRFGFPRICKARMIKRLDLF